MTGYSKESGKIKNIRCKNWHILRNDSTLGHLLPENPKIIFRKTPSLKDQVTSSYIKDNENLKNKFSGFKNCVHCKACTEITNNVSRKIIKDFFGNNGESYKLRDYTTCDTENIIYLIQCPCGFLKED